MIRDGTDDVDAIRDRKAAELHAKVTAPTEPVTAESTHHFEELVGDHSPVLVGVQDEGTLRELVESHA